MDNPKVLFPHAFAPRPEDCHKGTFGTVGIIGGSQGMLGAVMLAGMSALKTGCGKVWVGFHQESLPISVFERVPELMLGLSTSLSQYQDISAWGIGCGLGSDTQAREIVLQHFLAQLHNQPCVFDADALNILSQEKQPIHTNLSTCILTPHPKEASRLLKTTIAWVQSHRQEVAQQLANTYQAWVVLKGHHSIIASPTGQIWVNDSGNAGLATAGSGDVLTGIITSLLAQGIPTEEAVRAGVWLHGQSAEYLAKQGIGEVGLTASEIIDAVRFIRNQIIYNNI